MGAGNALAVYRQWSGKVTPQELHMLVYVALRTRDDDDTPTWWGGYAELHSRALGRKGDPNGAGAFTGVGKLVDSLHDKGAVTKKGRATGRSRVRMALHIAEGRRALAEERAEASNRTDDGAGVGNRSVNLAEVPELEGQIGSADRSVDLENRSVNLAEVTQSNRLTEGVVRTSSTTGASSLRDRGSSSIPSTSEPDTQSVWAIAREAIENGTDLSTADQSIGQDDGGGGEDGLEYERLVPVGERVSSEQPTQGEDLEPRWRPRWGPDAEPATPARWSRGGFG